MQAAIGIGNRILIQIYEYISKSFAVLATAGFTRDTGNTKDSSPYIHELTGEIYARDVERVMDVHGDRILRLAYSYMHNMVDAEDILQDVLISYMQRAPRFNDAEHEKAWLLRVASNISKNKIKYQKIRQSDELNEELTAEQRPDLSFVWEAVRDLPEQFREVVHLFYQEGCSTDEIGEILGLKGVTVRSRLNRGRKKLKAILREEYDFEE